MVGVNGTGKTTTIGKIAWHLGNEFGLDVVLGAADTYRAAAAEQLAEWAGRAGADLVRSAAGADPGSVAFDAIAAAKARSADVVIIDTAGRLHTQGNLMDELAKVRRVIGKQIPEAPHETLITIDATTGQNGLRQAKVFSDAVALDGVVLTKLDGTAKGGITLAIAAELGIPVKLIGTGEGSRGPEAVRPAGVRHRPVGRVSVFCRRGVSAGTGMSGGEAAAINSQSGRVAAVGGGEAAAIWSSGRRVAPVRHADQSLIGAISSAWSRRRNASTTCGSNRAPEPALISASVSSRVHGSNRGRPWVSVSKASATIVIRPPIGISSPLQARGGTPRRPSARGG